MEIKVLERQGRSIRQIMRETGLSRNTVRKYLRGAKVQYGPRTARPCKLDPFKPYLLERIEQARSDWIPATVLMREIQAAGYSGGISQLKAFIRPFKAVRSDPVVRFETAPGLQMQADFTTIRRGRDRLLAFVATLGYSRAAFVRFTDAERFEDWRDGLISAFEYFGGVPRQVLFDNTKTVIIKRDAYGPQLRRWHAGMLEVAHEYGFQLRVCRPYRARTKGKVERFNGYLKRSFLVPLSATLRAAGLKLDVQTANREVLRWLNEVANTRIHATTGSAPCAMVMSEHVAMDAVPWVLLGDARRAALCKRISDCTEVWRERWSRAREDITVTIGEPEARRPLVEAARAVCMGSVRWGWLLSARSTHDVAPDLLGMSGPGELRAAFSTSIAAQVQRQILESLCADVLAAANVQDRMTLEGSAAEAGSARQPAPLGVEVACGRMRIHLLLHARLVDALLPKSSATRPLPQVQRRKDAIAPERVRFEAVLGEVEVSLGELAELSVGDVIVLDQPLRTCGHLVMPDGRKVAPIVLGTAGTALAVSITAEPLGRGTQVIEE